MKYNISDLMDQAVPMAVELEEQPVCLENIKNRTLKMTHITQAPAKKQRNWMKFALIAACCAAFMMVTVVAGVKMWGNMTVRREDDRRGSMEYTPPMEASRSDTPVKTVGADFETVYLPTVFPGEEQLQSVIRMGDSSLFGYQWEWMVNDRQLFFTQMWGDTRIEIDYINHRAGADQQYGETELAGIPVSYVCNTMNGKPNSWDLLWSQDGYLFELRYSIGIPLEELAPVVASVQPVDDRAEYDAFVKEYTESNLLSDHRGRKTLKEVLFPTDLPEMLAFGGNLKEDSFLWYLAEQDAKPGHFLVQFYQEDADCMVLKGNPGKSGRRWELENSSYAETVELAGRSVQLLGGDADEYVWEYFWEQEGNWCHLRIDQDAADLLGMEIQELAEQIMENLTLTDYADAEARFE